MTIVVLTRMVFMIIWEGFHGMISLNSVLLLLLVKFMSGFRLELNCKPPIISIRSSLIILPCFQLLVLLTIVHRNHFFHLYQHNKFSESEVKFRESSNCYKTVETAKLAYAKELKKSQSLSRNLALGTFGELLIVFWKKVNLLYLLHSTAWRCCLLHLIRQNCLLKSFVKTQSWWLR